MIFLGAGASACFGINTSSELTKRIRDELNERHPDLLKKIDEFYQNSVGVEPDFEMYLTQLWALTDPSRIERYHYSIIFSNQNKNFQQNYRELIEKMYSEVVQACTCPFNKSQTKYLPPGKLDELFALTYDALFGVPLEYFKTKEILVFSTNYDPSIELWCQKRNIMCMDGTKSIFNPEINEKISLTKHITDLKSSSQNYSRIGLVRLHGSVWEYDSKIGNGVFKMNRPKDDLSFPDLYEEIQGKPPILIFPGEEDYLRIGKWDEYYQFFKDSLKGPCLFIGYSFRHSVINEQVRNKLETGEISKLGIMAPDPLKLVNNLYKGNSTPEDKIQLIPAYFGTEEGLQRLNNWFRTYFQKRYEQKDGLKNRAIGWQNERKKQYK